MSSNEPYLLGIQTWGKKASKRPRLSDGHSGPERNIRRIDLPTTHTQRNDSNKPAGRSEETAATAPMYNTSSQASLPRATTPPSRNLDNLSITDHADGVRGTPVRTSSSSRIHTPPTQFQNSISEQRVYQILTPEVAHASEERARALTPPPITRLIMEKMLQEEINGAIRMSNNFCQTCLSVAYSAHPNKNLREQLQKIAKDWLSTFQKWSTGLGNDKKSQNKSAQGNNEGRGGLSESDMYEPLVTLLNSIAGVASVPNHFRPCTREVVDYHTRTVATDDRDDTDAKPDLIQGIISRKGTIHWNDVEVVVECKAQPGLLHDAVMQLCRYARSTFIHQLHRNHVYSLAICGTQATFIRFDRSEIVHSSSLELSESKGLQEFVESTAGLFALNAEDFGYDTHFSFFPEPKGTEEDRLQRRQWRYTQGTTGQQWRIMEIICQRKCLIGRATTVLRLAKVDAPHTRCVIKIIWKPESRSHEGDSLKEFHGNKGMCQCEWMHTDVSTALPETIKLEHSTLQKFFFPDVKPEVFTRAMSRTSGTVSTSHSTSMNQIKTSLRHRQVRTHHPETRAKCVVMMGEGTSLWRITRLIHLLIVMRDALVGFAHIVDKGKIHRDISEGNILCDILGVGDNSDGDRSTGDEYEFKDDESEQGGSGRDHEHSSDEDHKDKSHISKTSESFAPVRTDDNPDQNRAIDIYGFLDTYEFPKEEKLIGISSLADYVEKRYRYQKDIGRIYDLEFMVDERRLDNPQKGRERTGTPAFISAQLLLASENQPVQHTYLHDLESLFWVFIWSVITHTRKHESYLDRIASKFVTDLRQVEDHALGSFKQAFISFSRLKKEMKFMNNGWDMAVVYHIAHEFAYLLHQQLYIEEMSPISTHGDGATTNALPSSPWETIYSVICIFDRYIIKLQEQEENT